MSLSDNRGTFADIAPELYDRKEAYIEEEMALTGNHPYFADWDFVPYTAPHDPDEELIPF